MAFPFVVRPLVKQSFFQRLLKQKPEVNAIIELNNLLATKNIDTIEIKDLQKIESKYKTTLKQTFCLNLEEFYVAYYNYRFKNYIISDAEKANIDHLGEILSLGRVKLASISVLLGTELYRDLLFLILRSKQELLEEKVKLNNIAAEFNFSTEVVSTLKSDALDEYVGTFLEKITKSNRYSPANESDFYEFGTRLGVTLELDSKTEGGLKSMRNLWNLENLPLPILDSRISVQKNEVYYFNSKSVTWSETRSDHGVQRLRELYRGELHVTSKRLVFEGPGKSVTIKLSSIINVIGMKGAIEIKKETGKNPVLEFSDWEQVKIILERVIRI